MSYFLKKTTPTAKGLYLQIYETNYIPGKGKRNKSYKSLGYVIDLQSKGINDPISYYQNEVDLLNKELIQTNSLQISEISTASNVGYFLVKCLFDYLDMDNTINVVASTFKSRYKFSDMFRSLCYSQILSPGSKHKAFEKVIPSIYSSTHYSYDQILDAVNFIGSDYHKYIEILNHHIGNIWPRKFDKVYFDCTNYYFEVDSEKEWIKKGPSKENRHCPLLGQALLLDANQIPLDTEFYSGNNSEISYLRSRIESMKAKNNVTGRVIHVADKGLNCARNIYSAVIESNDGYIFSKSIKGRNLSETQKEWVTIEDNDLNKWYDVRDSKGDLIYKYKTVKHKTTKGNVKDYGIYEYKCLLEGDKKDTVFTTKEKRIVTYNPTLAKKQRAEINKQADKANKLLTYKKVLKEDIGDTAKYITLEAKTVDGEKVKIVSSVNQEKIDADLKFAGYNMLITSEIDAEPKEVYKVYHNLWKIEECFRIMKSYLDARPVFLQKKESIHGHFLICYFSLTLMRLLENKIFEEEICTSQLIDFIRQYNVTKTKENSYINTSTASDTFVKIKEKLGLAKLGNVYLSKFDIDQLLKTEYD